MVGDVAVAINATISENELCAIAAGKKAKITSYPDLGFAGCLSFKKLLEFLSGKTEKVEGLGKDNLPTDIYVLLQLLNPAIHCEGMTARDLTSEETAAAINDVVTGLNTTENIDEKTKAIAELLNLDKSKSLSSVEKPGENPSNEKSEISIVKLSKTGNMAKITSTAIENNVEKQPKVEMKAELQHEQKKEVYDFSKTVAEEGRGALGEVFKIHESPLKTFEIALSAPIREEVHTSLDLPEGEFVSQKGYTWKIPALKDAIFGELVEKVQVALKGQMREIRIKIKPEHLGEMIVRITQDKGEVNAEFFVKNAHLKELMQSSVSEIKNHIAKQGYEINEIKIYDFPMQFDMHQQSERRFENDQYSNDHYRKVFKTSEEGEEKIPQNLKEVARGKTTYGIVEGSSMINYTV
ncbi:MAG: flagellar hook-length control protein FliK [Tepidanaerobacteraceae bacterium]|nr:flagellar hook-length control protein FliK [Tepidanaerobacteraceae bacterium]